MNIKKEIMEEFRKEFTEPLGGVFVIKTMNPLELEQRKFDVVCLIGKHFPDEDNQCERCYKVLTQERK